MSEGDNHISASELVEKYAAVHVPADEGPLRGVDYINWQVLEHAHGAADDVPALLKAALSNNKRDRDFAFLLLFETIWHQGDIYEASTYAVPFLFKMLNWPTMPDKEGVAHLLAALADGEAPLAEAYCDPEYASEWRHILAEQGRDLETELARQSGWVDATRRIVAEQVYLLYSYLSSPSPTVRWSIAKALARFPERAAETIPLLQQALQVERENNVKAQLRASLTALTDRTCL